MAKHDSLSAPLSTTLRVARTREAHLRDSFSNLTTARVLRLEILRDEIFPLLQDDENFKSFEGIEIISGDRPRLWIDLISYVVMEPDPRTYCVMQNIESKTVKIFESTDLEKVIGFLKEFLAQRVLAQKQLAANAAVAATTAAAAIATQAADTGKFVTEKSAGIWLLAVVFLTGVLSTLALMLGAFFCVGQNWHINY